MIIIAYWILKGKTSEKGFVWFFNFILHILLNKYHRFLFKHFIIFTYYDMISCTQNKHKSFNMIKIYRKNFHTSTAEKSKLFHVIPYRHTYFRIFKNSLFFVKRQNDWMPFLKVFFFKYLYFVVWNTTWLVRNKKKCILKSRTLPSNHL